MNNSSERTLNINRHVLTAESKDAGNHHRPSHKVLFSDADGSDWRMNGYETCLFGYMYL